MKGLIRSISVAIVLAWAGAAQAVPVPCVVCGSTVITGIGPNSGTVSCAGISGADFLVQGFPFAGAVPGGTLDALGATGAIPALGPGPLVDFSIFFPGPCLGSAPNRACSDGATTLLATSVEMIRLRRDTDRAAAVDPAWTSRRSRWPR